MRAFLFLLVLSLLAACAPAPAPATPTPVNLNALATEIAATVLADLTQAAPTPESSPTPAPTETLAPTLTPSPTPLARYAEFVITRIAYRDVGGVNITIKLPGITGDVNLELNGGKFTCKFDRTYPDVVLCAGLYSPPIDTTIPVAFINPATGQVDYQGVIVLRQTMYPTPTPASSNWCPERGKNLDAEWECRIDDNGSPCVVATVRDACGYYYSVDSCPADMTLPSPICSPEQFDAMRKLYGFP